MTDQKTIDAFRNATPIDPTGAPLDNNLRANRSGAENHESRPGRPATRDGGVGIPTAGTNERMGGFTDRQVPAGTLPHPAFDPSKA